MPGQPMPGIANSPKSNNRVFLYAGLGCGALLLLGILGTVASVMWLKSCGNAALDELQRLQASASAMAAGASAPAGSGAQANSAGELTGDCVVAYRCCVAIASKSPAGAAATQACEVFKTPAYPGAVCSSALGGYRKVAAQTGVKCD